jgi:multidrug efflux system membrane fusion protein
LACAAHLKTTGPRALSMTISSNRNRIPGGSWGLVGLIIAALVLWMLTGAFSSDKPEAAEKATRAAEKFHVMVREQSAQQVHREVTINGTTQPDQIVNLAAQVEGQVVAIGARKGTRVKKGDLIARLDSRDLAQHKAREAAILKARELEYEGAQKLQESGYLTATELAAKLAALESARSELKDTQFKIANLQIRAPVDGIVEDQQVEVGDYARVGSPIARLIVNDPLRLSGGVNEQDVRLIEIGHAATAILADGEKLAGRVRFVSAMADEKTRSFTVEIAVANPDGRIPAGLSARVSIPVEEVLAHRIPASLLSLADDGEIGVKFVGDGDKVVFQRARIVRADVDAMWLAGLPERIRLITRGQGFVNAGETVAVQQELPAEKTPE